MISVVIGLAYLNKLNQKTNSSKTSNTEPKITRTDYSAVARKTLDWIDKQRNDDGWYILERGCDYEKKTCDTVWDNEEGNKDGLIATWARFNFYQQTKDPKDLEIVKSDINKFYEKYPNGVDNALWICKITYDMWKSDLFDQSIKDKLERICFGSNISLSGSVDDLLKENISKVVSLGKQDERVWKTWDGYSLLVRGWNAYFGYPSDLVFKYIWRDNSAFLVESKDYFEALKKQIESGLIVNTEDQCLMGLSALDIYQFAGKDVSYFNYASSFYENFITMSGNPRKVTTPMCGLLSKELYFLTKDSVYLSKLEFNNMILTEFNFDGENNIINHDNSFFRSDTGLLFVPFKRIVENGLIVELIQN